MVSLKSESRYSKRLQILCVSLLIAAGSMLAQTTNDEISSFIAKVDQGQVDAVRQAMPDLVAKYQNTPGLLYLQARIASDGIEAVKFYQSVVDNFPKSEWADDALYRIYQYYYALGLYRTAELKLGQLRKEYPKSPFVTGTREMKLPGQEDHSVNLPTKDTIVVDSPKIVPAQPPPDSSRPIATPAASQSYTLQVGAFSTVRNAEKQRNFFEDLGYQAEIANKVRGGRSLHLVWVGNFKTAEEAMLRGKEMKAKYKIDFLVVEKY